MRKLRYRHRWSQSKFATKLQHCGWAVSRATVAKIESRVRASSMSRSSIWRRYSKSESAIYFRGPTSGADLSKACSIERIFVFQSNFAPHAEQVFSKSM